MRTVLAAVLVMMLGRVAAAEVRTQTAVLSLDDADGKLVEATVVKRVPNTTRCFGGREATVDVSLTIQNNKLVEATASESGDAKLDACVQKLVKKMKLASSSAHIRFRISARKPIDPALLDRLARSPSVLATLNGAQPTMTGTSTNGTLGGHSADDINRVFRSRAGEFRTCYQREAAKNPKLAGKLVFTATIDEKGAVTRVDQEPSTLKSKAVATCVSSTIKRLKFPAKGKAIVTYPFVFTSAQ
ncbi:MAG: AgmX/PglI C-terminal domain-containing protein [Kofleriaceae bacterium]|nr:AgmX/PglI C-terminal domain-containing protein [Kofleriaceae bacterium]